jgi:hypothetical protein
MKEGTRIERDLLRPGFGGRHGIDRGSEARLTQR